MFDKKIVLFTWAIIQNLVDYFPDLITLTL